MGWDDVKGRLGKRRQHSEMEGKEGGKKGRGMARDVLAGMQTHLRFQT